VALGLALAAAGTFLLGEAAPLHWFAPGIYETGAAPVVGFISAAAKTTGFALLLRLFLFVFFFAQQKWIYVWGGVAILSLLWGSVAALRQANLMHLFAYGAVAHGGFIVLGLVSMNEAGFNGMAYYIGSYVFATIGAFGVLVVLRQRDAASSLAELAGLSRTSPTAAWLLLFFLLALAGMPPTAGFIARYYIVKALITAGHPELAAFAVLSALAAAIFYGRVAAHAFRQSGAAEKPAGGAIQPFTISNAQTVALTAAAFVSLAAGLYPAPFLRIASYVFGQ
jgi:NADH-quinone oxidoreductase subunit N